MFSSFITESQNLAPSLSALHSPKNLPQAVPVNVKGHVDGLVLQHAAVSVQDFDPQSIENDDRIHAVHCPGLPLPDLVEHRIGDAADQVRRHLKTVDDFQMGPEVADGQPGGAEANDLVIHPVDPGLALLHKFRLKTAIPVALHRNRHFAVLALQALVGSAIALVHWVRRGVLALFIAKVRRHLAAEHPLHQLDLEVFQQPGVAKQVFR